MNVKIHSKFWDLSKYYKIKKFDQINYFNKFFPLSYTVSYSSVLNKSVYMDLLFYSLMENSAITNRFFYAFDIEHTEYFDTSNSFFESSAYFWNLFFLDNLYKYSVLLEQSVFSQFDNFWTNYWNYIQIVYLNQAIYCIVIELKYRFF